MKTKEHIVNLQEPLLETADELFEALWRISNHHNVRTRYGVLREVLMVGVDQQLRDVTVKMSGLYAKIDYLVKKHQLRENDRSLSFAINDTRNRLRYLTLEKDQELADAWLVDLKAVVRFLELVYQAAAPGKLQHLLPRTTKRVMPQREKDAAGRDEPYFRCIINK